MPELSRSEIEDIAEVIASKLKADKAGYWVDAQVHAEHHRTLAEWIAQEKQRRESAQRVKEQVAGWFSITFITGLLGFILLGAIDWLRALIRVGS